MSYDPKKQSRAWIGWTLIAGLVLYPLSMGPVWWLSDHFDLWSGGFVGGPQFVAYAPLFWIGEHCATFGKALIWYVHLWADIAG
jgi:hypothetical protein